MLLVILPIGSLTTMDFSTKKITPDLIDEIKTSLQQLDWGSIEIFVQDSTVVQITRRQIKKTASLAKSALKRPNYPLTNK
jgi:hypothetical protein